MPISSIFRKSAMSPYIRPPASSAVSAGAAAEASSVGTASGRGSSLSESQSKTKRYGQSQQSIHSGQSPLHDFPSARSQQQRPSLSTTMTGKQTRHTQIWQLICVGRVLCVVCCV